MRIIEFADTIQKASLPGIWSKGITLFRAQAVVLDSRPLQGQPQDGEWNFRVRSPDQPVHQKVSLWPGEEDWYCECEAKTEVCAHVVAATLTLKHLENTPSDSPTPTLPKPSAATLLRYEFTRSKGDAGLKEGRLNFSRWLISQTQSKQLLSSTLISWMGGIQSGRIASPPIAATQADYKVDAVVAEVGSGGEWDAVSFQKLFRALSECSSLFLEDQPITVASKPLLLKAELKEEALGGKGGFRLRISPEPTVTERFKNGAVLCGDVLKAIELPALSPQEKELLRGEKNQEGTLFTTDQLPFLFTRILPALEKKIFIQKDSSRLPEFIPGTPKIILHLEAKKGDSLSVVPQLTYENPQGTSAPGNRKTILLPDPEMEKALYRQLQTELQLLPGQTVEFQGSAAVEFCLRAKHWTQQGDGKEAFSLRSPLVPQLNMETKAFSVSFQTTQGSQAADPARVFQAWRTQESWVPLLGGGWAPLPRDWLSRYGERIESLLLQKNLRGEIPPYLLPEIAEICEENNQSYPDPIHQMREKLKQVERIPIAPLPKDLTGVLRPYQQLGVNWLQFLRETKIGALLADDMGLGKTIQALCAIQGKTLIVSPTSVLPSWKDQITRFRPGLSLATYYGPQRALDLSKDVILTSYAILRLDREKLTQIQWGTALLDEAQTIKNPESQVTQAAYALSADFKIALSGTPVENRLSDLWSQFHFLNPGLLGTLKEFQEQFSGPIANGKREPAERLRKKTRPFILRRLKKEVAPELPPKTELVLYAELGEKEREVYDALLFSTRKEVIEKLESGGSVFSALELILRLRQACCHVSLLPGQSLPSSAKLTLLTETLEQSLSQGHRALIFSQWTSYLDLIEPELHSRKIDFLRLDGTTRNRGEVVSRFQSEEGPPVLLLSLKAGGVGLTLTAADHLFLMDPWWNPAVEEQATDRAHRIGQSQPVWVHRMITQNTVEEKILALQKSKLQLMAAVLEGGAQTAQSTLNREDLLELLSV